MGENIDYQQKEVSPYSGYDISYDKFSQFGTRLGLERMEVLLTALGNPQDNLKYCHIAGTNGKGSVSATLTASLAAANFPGRSLYLSLCGKVRRANSHSFRPGRSVALASGAFNRRNKPGRFQCGPGKS